MEVPLEQFSFNVMTGVLIVTTVVAQDREGRASNQDSSKMACIPGRNRSGQS